MSLYNPSRFDEQILSQFASSPPSFTVNFYPEHWLINNSRPNLYHTPISFLLDDIRERRIPADWLQTLDENGVSFYDGCLIIELVDHRTSGNDEPPTKERVVLPLDSETLWNDIRLETIRTGKLTTDEEALDFEARILAATSPPLCLEPDIMVSRIANAALRASALAAPIAFRKKDAAVENERDDALKAREGKIMSLMNPHKSRSTHPSSRLFEIIQRRQQDALAGQPPANTFAAEQAIVPTATGDHSQAQQKPTPAPLHIPPANQFVGGAAKDGKKKFKQPKVEDAPTPMPPPPPTPDSELIGSGKIKRKASITAPTPPPPAMKRKMTGKRQSESVEPSPAIGHTQLPTATQIPPPSDHHQQPPQTPQQHAQQQLPQQPVAYQLPPSTTAAVQFAIANQKKNAMKKAAAQAQVLPVKKTSMDQTNAMTPQMTQGHAQTPMHGQLQATMQMAQGLGQNRASPIPSTSHPNQSKPSTPQPGAIPPQQPQQPQHILTAQQHPQYAQQMQMLTAAGNNPAVAAAYLQHQHQLQMQAAAARGATASPRPPAQQQAQPPHAGAQFPQSQFTFPMQLQMNRVNQANAVARMNNANMNLMAQGGQMNPHLQQQMLAMGMMPHPQSPFQQQAHAASPQIQHRSPHPGAAQAQAPSRPSSTLPPQQPPVQTQGQAQAQVQAHQFAQNQALLRAQQQQHHFQQQLQQQQAAAQFNMQMMPNQNFQLQLPINGGGGNSAANAAAAAAMMMNGGGGQPQAGWRMPLNPQANRTPQQQAMLQQMNMAYLNGIRNGGVPGQGQGQQR